MRLRAHRRCPHRTVGMPPHLRGRSTTPAVSPGYVRAGRCGGRDRARASRHRAGARRAALQVPHRRSSIGVGLSAAPTSGTTCPRTPPSTGQALAHHLASALPGGLGRGPAASMCPCVPRPTTWPGCTDDTSAPREHQRPVPHHRADPGRPPRSACSASSAMTPQSQSRSPWMPCSTGPAPRWANRRSTLAGYLAAWDPVIAGITSAADGDQQAREAVEQHLTHRQDSADWGKLAGTLRAILYGARDGEPAEGTRRRSTPRSPAAPSPPYWRRFNSPRLLWAAIPMSGLFGRVIEPRAAPRKRPVWLRRCSLKWPRTAAWRRWSPRWAV